MEQNSSQPVKIDSKIVGYSVVKASDGPVTQAPVIVQEVRSHQRPDVVEGATYKIKPPTWSSALYITINNLVMEDGSRRPIEIFVNTKDTSHYQWVVAMTRVISALFRKPGEFLFVIEELEQVFDPQGAYWGEGAHAGKMIPSVVAHIGLVLKQHCRDLGLITGPVLSSAQLEIIAEKVAVAEAQGIKGTRCPKCSEEAMILIDNCLTCTACGESKCG